MRYDLVIRNATVIDGTRAPRFKADIAVSGARIAEIGELGAARGAAEIDARGKVAAPGFIDVHTHDDRLLLSTPDMAPKVSQGVTTVVTGNCGISLAPAPGGMRAPVVPPLDLLDKEGGWFRFPTFSAYIGELEAHPAAANCAPLVGHSTLRVAVMKDVSQPARPEELARMRALADEALAAGAIGVSTGLYYEPASAATTEEVIEVCRGLPARGGLYCTHMRDEADAVLESLEETFRIGRELGVPVVISHHKVVGRQNYGRSRDTLACIAQHMRAQPVGLDCYPYCASSTILSADRIRVASKVLVTWSKPLPQYAGMDLADIAAEMKLTPEEAVARLVPAGAIYFAMDEADVQRILQFEHTMIGSDGLPHDSAPHPRLWGTFPRVLGHYSRGLNLFPLETAVHKMTGLPAKTFGLAGRGELKAGNFADLTIFDPGGVNEAASYEKPVQPASGIEAVFVNGVAVWERGAATGARPGQVLRRAAIAR